VFDIRGDLTLATFGGGGSFSNAGTLRRSFTSGVATLSAPFVNTGTVDVQTGSLRFAAPGTSVSSGPINGAPGTTLDFAATTLNAIGAVNGASVLFSGGTTNLSGAYAVTGGTTATAGIANFTGPVTSVGPLVIGAATVDFSTGGGITLPSLTLSGGSLEGTDAVTVGGLLTWSGGTMEESGGATAPGGKPLSRAAQT